MLIIVGSSRAKGNTTIVVERLASRLLPRPAIRNLAHSTLAPPAAAHASSEEAARIGAEIDAHACVVFATPVYWYAMSAQLKTLFEQMGEPGTASLRHGRGGDRSAWLVATGSDPVLPLGFEVPLMRSAAAMNRRWGGSLYIQCADGAPPQDEDLQRADVFAAGLGTCF